MISSTGLTDDILIEIFTYLPLNPIYKFKCLSKVWLSNLSHPNFITKWFQINCKSLPWIQYHPNTHHDSDENPKMAYPNLYSQFMSRNEHLFSFRFLMNAQPFGTKLFLLGSSSGLVLCYTLHSDNQRRYHVCNPLTQKWVSLPSPPQVSSLDINGIFFEYPCTSCYKALLIPKFQTPLKKFNVHIFSSDFWVWESFQVSCDENVVFDWINYDNFVILNGVLFWIQEGKKMLVYNLNQNNGSDGHQCSLIDLPDEEFDDGGIRHPNNRVGNSEGRVCYTKTKWTGREMNMSIWVLDEVNWQILHKDIPIEDLLADLRSRIVGRVKIQVIGFSPVDRNVVLLSWKHMVWGFNFLTRRYEKLWGFNIHYRTVEEICFDTRNVHSSERFSPFGLKPMPTVLPPPSWIDT